MAERLVGADLGIEDHGGVVLDLVAARPPDHGDADLLQVGRDGRRGRDQVGADEGHDLVLLDHPLGDGQGGGGVAAVVAEDQLDGVAGQAAPGVDVGHPGEHDRSLGRPGPGPPRRARRRPRAARPARRPGGCGGAAGRPPGARRWGGGGGTGRRPAGRPARSGARRRPGAGVGRSGADGDRGCAAARPDGARPRRSAGGARRLCEAARPPWAALRRRRAGGACAPGRARPRRPLSRGERQGAAGGREPVLVDAGAAPGGENLKLNERSTRIPARPVPTEGRPAGGCRAHQIRTPSTAPSPATAAT